MPDENKDRGVLIITGGPQYRVGSHRQFLLLARMLADNGYPVLRFDYHGMGDSSGRKSDFMDCREDVHAAISAFRSEGRIREVVLLGLCDAASASLMYVAEEATVAGMILLNPWVRSDAGIARAHLRHYYVRRLLSADFIRKSFSGNLDLRKAGRDLWDNVRDSVSARDRETKHLEPRSAGAVNRDFRAQMLEGLSKFRGPVLIVLSGNDLTAAEFVDHTSSDKRWKKSLRRQQVTQRRLEDSDHTFSREVWRNTLAQWTLDWLKSW